MMASLRILQMMLAYLNDNEQSIDEVFDEQEQRCLQMIGKKMEGGTEKLKNPTKANTLKWATWINCKNGWLERICLPKKARPYCTAKGFG